jgi:serine/threonine protein kinase
MPGRGPLWHDLRSGAPHFALAPESPIRSPELEDLVRVMMEKNPEKRITVEQILEHEILRNIYTRREYINEEGKIFNLNFFSQLGFF